VSRAHDPSLAAVQAQSPAAPPFRAGVELLTVDVQVAAKREVKMDALKGEDFALTFWGKSRPIVSATFAHLDEGAVADDIQPEQAKPDCVFGYLRKAYRRTAHYVLAVDMTEPDRKQTAQVEVTTVDDTYLFVNRFAWRSPIRGK
jgi:hypothetical protein